MFWLSTKRELTKKTRNPTVSDHEFFQNEYISILGQRSFIR